MSRIADNADYVASQISFLKEGTELIDPSSCPGRVLFCYICREPIPRFYSTKYYYVCGKSKRICKVCYEKYKQTFEVRFKKRGK